MEERRVQCIEIERLSVTASVLVSVVTFCDVKSACGSDFWHASTISIVLAENLVARARHVVCHPVDRKPQGEQQEDEKEERSRKKPDANKSTAEGARASGQRKNEKEREREKVKEGFRLQYGSQTSSGDGNKSEVMIFKRQRRCRALER